MKHVIIVAVLAVLAAYAWGVTRYHGTVPVPGCQTVEIDLSALANPETARSASEELVRARYLRVPNQGGKIAPDQALTDKDFQRMLQSLPAGQRKVKVIDQSAILDLVAKKYHFRNDETVNGQRYSGRDKTTNEEMTGNVIDQAAAWNLALDGNYTGKRLAVDGHGDTVALQPGTMLMIVIIFIGLLCALKIILYDPLLKIMDERDAEIAAGNARTRENLTREAELEARHAARRAGIRQEHHAALAQARHEVQKVADGMLRDARDEARRIGEENAREIAAAVETARTELDAQAPVLGREIAARVLGRTEKGDKA